MDKCKLICQGIKDEQEGQKYYKKLKDLFELGSDERIKLTLSYEDEIEHEKRLNVIKSKLPDCVCDKEYKILKLDDISKLPKEKRIEIVKGIWK